MVLFTSLKFILNLVSVAVLARLSTCAIPVTFLHGVASGIVHSDYRNPQRSRRSMSLMLCDRHLDAKVSHEVAHRTF